MFAEVVVLANVIGYRRGRRVQENRTEGKAGNVLEDVRMFYCVRRVFSPGKGSVSSDQRPRNGNGIEPPGAKVSNDDCAGISHVAAGDFLRGEGFGDGDRAVEVIGVRGAEAGDGTSSLRPGGGKFRMCVNDASNRWEFAIEESVGIKIAGRAKGAFDDIPVEIGDDEIASGEGGVVDSTGLDDDERLGAVTVDAARIPEGMRGEAATGDFAIGLEYLMAERFQKHGVNSYESALQKAFTYSVYSMACAKRELRGEFHYDDRESGGAMKTSGKNDSNALPPYRKKGRE